MQEVTAEVEPQVTGSNASPAKRYNVAVDHNPSNSRSIELRHHKRMQHPRLVEEIFTLRHLSLGLQSLGTSSSRISNAGMGWLDPTWDWQRNRFNSCYKSFLDTGVDST